MWCFMVCVSFFCSLFYPLHKYNLLILDYGRKQKDSNIMQCIMETNLFQMQLQWCFCTFCMRKEFCCGLLNVGPLDLLNGTYLTSLPHPPAPHSKISLCQDNRKMVSQVEAIDNTANYVCNVKMSSSIPSDVPLT